MNEYYEMKVHPEKYKKYSLFRSAMNDVAFFCAVLGIGLRSFLYDSNIRVPEEGR